MMAIPSAHESSSDQYRVITVEDHPTFRMGLVSLLNNQPDMVVCCECETAEETEKAIADYHPDLVIVDISLKGVDGLSLIKWIKMNYPDLHVMALSVHSELVYAERVLRAGAKGYVMKLESPETVVQAIRQVLSGDLYLSDTIKRNFLSRMMESTQKPSEPGVAALTDRELEVFRLIGEGYSTPRIAELLELSPKTVETYRTKIMSKMKLEGSNELFLRAFIWNEREGVENNLS